MKEKDFEVLKYTGLAFLSVIVSAFLTYYVTSDNTLGNAFRFAVPMLTGVAAGLWIHLRFRDLLDFEEQ